jgi:hypothetical protein
MSVYPIPNIIPAGSPGGVHFEGRAMARKKRLSKRLARTAEHYKQLNIIQLKWDDEVHRSRVAHAALKLNNTLSGDDPPLKRAFDAFGLHPEDPNHWALLLRIFAREHFPEPPIEKSRGRPAIWTEEKQQRFEKHVEMILGAIDRTGMPLPDPETFAELIQKDIWPDWYTGANALSRNEIIRRAGQIRAAWRLREKETRS